MDISASMNHWWRAMKAIAPGKIIISGEHAVVYGAPAVGMAVDRNAVFQLKPQVSDEISFDLEHAAASSFTLLALRDLKKRIERKYSQFQQGELGIRYVLSAPADLFRFAFIHALDGLHRTLDSGLVMKLRSTIPVGCGMGSSAATVLSEIRALGHYLRVDFKPDWYYEYSLEVERLQHGYPSGIDSYMALHGGCTYFKEGQGQKIPMPSVKMFLVETGIPESSTGVCVETVRKQFGSSSIWSEFVSVTEEVRTHLETNEQSKLYESIRANHRLLDQIGVVPGRVSQFIREVEARGGAAKICGAGAVEGEAAGVLIVLADETPTALCEKYGYTVSPLRGDPLGTRLV